LSALEIQNWLIFFTLVTTICLSRRAGIQSKKALNVDINFRALERRKEVLNQLEHTLTFFTRDLGFMGKTNPSSDDSDNMVGVQVIPLIITQRTVQIQYDEALPIIEEAKYLFPKTKKDLENLCKHLSKFVNMWNTNNENDFNRAKKGINKTCKKVLSLMKEYLDISQFSILGY
jgi:hypothetical protein